MNILLDTCVFLWIIEGSEKLSDKVRRAVSDPSNSVSLSVVSVWEIIIKHSIGKLPLPQSPQEFVDTWRTKHQIESLPLDESAVFQLARLPDYHNDPFDRMLICQAIAGSMVIMTPDSHISRYPVRTMWE